MENEQNKKDVLLPASIIVAAVLISGSIFYMVGNQNRNNIPPDGGSPSNNSASAADVLKIQGGEVVLGSENAPVTLVEYGDYQCPWCGKFFEESEKPLREAYIKTNQVKMIYRNFAFLGPESTAAALAAECAKDQSQFWAYHDALYTAEQKDGAENNGNLTEELFLKIAGDLKLNTVTFKTCLDTQKYADKVTKDRTDGQSISVNGTPAIFVNNNQIGGFLAFDGLKSAIDAALRE